MKEYNYKILASDFSFKRLRKDMITILKSDQETEKIFIEIPVRKIHEKPENIAKIKYNIL